jgi:hypothetical protein
MISTYKRFAKNILHCWQEHNGKQQLVAVLKAKQMSVDERHKQSMTSQTLFDCMEKLRSADVGYDRMTDMTTKGEK